MLIHSVVSRAASYRAKKKHIRRVGSDGKKNSQILACWRVSRNDGGAPSFSPFRREVLCLASCSDQVGGSAMRSREVGHTRVCGENLARKMSLKNEYTADRRSTASTASHPLVCRLAWDDQVL